MQPTKKVSPVIIALIVIVLVGIGTAVAVVANQSKETTTADSTTTESTKTEESQTDTAQSSTNAEGVTYKDGTYTEVGKYVSPGGAESIDVSVTIANDVITSATVTPNATRGEAKEHQQDFVAAFKSLVVGKNIDEVKLSRVAGASLTSNGFNSALQLIKADAEA